MYDGKLAVVKVGAVSNPADLLTKHLKAEAASGHLERCDYEPRTGRASSALRLMEVQEAQPDRVEAVACTEQLLRQNRKPRFIFFTPMKLAGGPSNAGNVGFARVTVSSHFDRRQFCKADAWNTATRDKASWHINWKQWM